MFNVGGGEIIVIALIALIVLGPQRLPEAARQVGKVLGDLRKLSSGFQNEMKTAFVEADDPTRIAARRNVLAKEAPTDPATDAVEPTEVEAGSEADGDPATELHDVDPAVSDAIAAVAAPREPPPTAKATPPAGAKTTSVTHQARKQVPEVDAQEPETEADVSGSPSPEGAP